MSKNFLKLYSVQLLLSFALAVVLTAVSLEREFVNVVFIMLGCILGTFFIDLDYVLHAYLLAPKSQEASLVKDYLKHFDLSGFFMYAHSHKADFPEKTLNSALFQFVLAAAIFFSLGSNLIFVNSLLLSIFLNSGYRMLEEYFHNNAGEWFWNFKLNPSPRNIYAYLMIMGLVILYGIWIF